MMKETLQIRSDLLSNWPLCFLGFIVWAIGLAAFLKNDTFVAPFFLISVLFIGLLYWLQFFEVCFQDQEMKIKIPFKKVLRISYADIQRVKFLIADLKEGLEKGPLFQLIIERTDNTPHCNECQAILKAGVANDGQTFFTKAWC